MARTTPSRPAADIGFSPIHGLGVFASRAFRAGARVGAFGGVPGPRPVRRAGRFYAIGLDDGSFLGPPEGAATLWFVNHSCAPNCDIVTRGRVARLVALRAIRPGEELTCDYRPSLHNGRLRCRCGAPGCAGWI